MLGEYEVCATVAVSDLSKSAEFYGQTLGLKKSMESPGGIFFSSGTKSGIFVYQSEYAGTNKATSASWSCPDVDKLAEELKSQGIQFERYEDIPGAVIEGDVHVMGGMRSAWFKDPDGNVLNIVNQ